MIDAALAEKLRAVCRKAVCVRVERYEKRRRRIQVIEIDSVRQVFGRRGEKWVRCLLQIRNHSLKLAVLRLVAALELFLLHEPRAVGDLPECMREAGPKVAAQLVHALSAE